MSRDNKSSVKISIVVAMSAHDRAIGKNGKLLWHIPEDLKRFKQLTLGHPVIMGRKTFESVLSYLGGPMPRRSTIVITRNPDYIYTHENVIICPSFEEAVQKAKKLDSKEIFIGGGSEIYKRALPHTDYLYLTLINGKKEADTFFPPYEKMFTKKGSEETHETPRGLSYTWVTLKRG